jgi:hypothetical protein
MWAEKKLLMAYGFNFDLTKISQNVFRDIARFSDRTKVHEKIGSTAKFLVNKFSLEKVTGLPVADTITVIEDLIDTQVKNVTHREAFLKTKRRALLLPHCSRKYMDSRCKALFDTERSSYVCQHCSPDCLINRATRAAEEKGYDVYVLPGGSGIKKALSNKNYDGLVGVACTEEIKLGGRMLEGSGLVIQGVPLIKNGCSCTKFNLDTLMNTL